MKIVPDTKYPNMFRIQWAKNDVSDMYNISWAKHHLAVACENDRRQLYR